MKKRKRVPYWSVRPNRSRFEGKIYDAIWERDDGTCVYCREAGHQIDHVVPRTRGGRAIRSNGVVCCRSCNTKKRAKIEFDFLFIAFFHLLEKGESLEWLDELYETGKRDVA